MGDRDREMGYGGQGTGGGGYGGQGQGDGVWGTGDGGRGVWGTGTGKRGMGDRADGGRGTGEGLNGDRKQIHGAQIITLLSGAVTTIDSVVTTTTAVKMCGQRSKHTQENSQR